MVIRLAGFVLAIQLILSGQSAKADLYYFNYSDTTGNVINGTLATTTQTPSPYTGLDLSTWGSMTLSGSGNAKAYNGDYYLVSGGPGNSPIPYYPPAYFDNLLFPTGNSNLDPNNTGINKPGGFLDYDGLLFTSGGSNPTYIDIYFRNNAYSLLITGNDINANPLLNTGQNGTFSISTPEPSSLTLLIPGIGCLTALLGIRRRMTAVA